MLSVHVGLHKTGTTSIQTALELSRGDVSRRQAYLRWTDLFLADGVINAAGLPRIRSLSARGWHAVVSSEGALGSMSTVYSDAAPVVRQLDELFGDQGLRVIVYLRPQHEWAASAYGQYVKEGGAQHSRDFVATLREQPHLRYTALIEDIRSSLRLGKLIVRPYKVGMDTVSDFFDVAGLGPVPAYLGRLRANESPVVEYVEELRHANEASAGAVMPRAPSDLLSAEPIKRSPLPEDCQADLHALFMTDWTELTAVVAAMPGYDATEFLDVTNASRDWVPRPFFKPRLQLEATPQRVLTASSKELSPANSTKTERVQRWKFQLRHGPRLLLLKTVQKAA